MISHVMLCYAIDIGIPSSAQEMAFVLSVAINIFSFISSGFLVPPETFIYHFPFPP